MEYTVQKLAEVSGLSPRALRHYDKIGLLSPGRRSEAGYRLYGEKEVDMLQQILFYRELGMPLSAIREILSSPSFEKLSALQSHRKLLLSKKERLERLIDNVEASIAAAEGGKIMSDREKFEAFKENLIAENEEKYGAEVREKYGDEAMEKSNARLRDMTKEEFGKIEDITRKVLETLKKAMENGDPYSEKAQEAADLHRQFLSFYSDGYSKEYHRQMADMYVADRRFAAYYEKAGPDAAAFLQKAVYAYTEK